MPRWSSVIQNEVSNPSFHGGSEVKEAVDNDSRHVDTEVSTSTGSAIPESQLPPAPQESQSIIVIVRHWLRENQIRVVLPKRAKFKHIKKAVAKSLGNDTLLKELQLIRNVDGIYIGYKDNEPIGENRLVLVRCSESDLPKDEVIEVVLADADVSEGDLPATFPERSKTGAPADSIARRVRAGNPLPRSFAKSLLKELLEAFGSNDFQQKLASWQACMDSSASNVDGKQDLRSLMLAELARILPKYGFHGSPHGVEKMLGALVPFFDDSNFYNIWLEMDKLRQRLGLGSKEPYYTIANPLGKLQGDSKSALQELDPMASKELTSNTQSLTTLVDVDHTCQRLADWES